MKVFIAGLLSGAALYGAGDASTEVNGSDDPRIAFSSTGFVCSSRN